MINNKLTNNYSIINCIVTYFLQNGCYLVRRSKNGGETKPYTLAIIYSGQVFNLNIRKKTNSKYALGMAKADEQVWIVVWFGLVYGV